MPEHSERVRRNYPDGVVTTRPYRELRQLPGVADVCEGHVMQYDIRRGDFVCVCGARAMTPEDHRLYLRSEQGPEHDGSPASAARILTEQVIDWFEASKTIRLAVR